MEYIVKLYAANTITDRNINAWIKNWNDHAGGSWGKPQAASDTQWSVSLDTGSKTIESGIKKSIDQTIRNNEGLEDWGYAER